MQSEFVVTLATVRILQFCAPNNALVLVDAMMKEVTIKSTVSIVSTAKVPIIRVDSYTSVVRGRVKGRSTAGRRSFVAANFMTSFMFEITIGMRFTRI
jgi:hypothetical protein